MITVNLDPPTVESRSLQRIATALSINAPSEVELVHTDENADAVVIHVIGRHDQIVRRVNALRAMGKRYIIAQYCLRSTRHPLCADWIGIWKHATLVWSYYDLPAMCQAEGVTTPFPFLHSPLGADAKVFYPSDSATRYAVATTGYTPGAECLREVTDAARRNNYRVLHLGLPVPTVNYDRITYMSNIDDATLRRTYTECNFVSALRRLEGFELPAVEGIFCGVRPILFDTPTYRHWYDKFGIFVPETGSSADLTDNLTTLLRHDSLQLTDLHVRAARAMFDWPIVARRFWTHVL